MRRRKFSNRLRIGWVRMKNRAELLDGGKPQTKGVAERVKEWQHRQHAITRVHRKHTGHGIYVGDQIPMRQLYAFGNACASAREYDARNIVWSNATQDLLRGSEAGSDQSAD